MGQNVAPFRRNCLCRAFRWWQFQVVQVVAAEEELKNFDELIHKMWRSACFTGALLLTPGAKQPFELRAQTVLGRGTSALNIRSKNGTPLNTAHRCASRPRTNTLSAVYRVRSVAALPFTAFSDHGLFIHIAPYTAVIAKCT